MLEREKKQKKAEKHRNIKEKYKKLLQNKKKSYIILLIKENKLGTRLC